MSKPKKLLRNCPGWKFGNIGTKNTISANDVINSLKKLP